MRNEFRSGKMDDTFKGIAVVDGKLSENTYIVVSDDGTKFKRHSVQLIRA